MATKRRRVWVNFYEDGSNDGCAFETKGDAKESAPTAYVMTQVAFIERLPGDVVLPAHVAGAVQSQLRRVRATLRDLCAWDDLAVLNAALGLLRVLAKEGRR